MTTLAERISALRSRSQRVRDVGEWDAIIADVRELERKARNWDLMLECADKAAAEEADATLTKTKGQNA